MSPIETLESVLVPIACGALGWCVQFVWKLSKDISRLDKQLSEFTQTQSMGDRYTAENISELKQTITKEEANIKELIAKQENTIKDTINELKVETKQITTENKTKIDTILIDIQNIRVTIEKITGGVKRRFQLYEGIENRLQILERYAAEESPVMRDVTPKRNHPVRPPDSYQTFAEGDELE